MSGARVSGVILAAGPSKRFGKGPPKQLLEIDGEPMVRRTCRTALASRLRQLLVVVGHESATVGAVLAGLAVEIVDNPLYARGQSRSIRAALSRIELHAEAAVFIPCDQPFLSADLIDRLIARFEETGGPIVVPTFEGRPGAPVLISSSFFAELSTVQGDEGARQLFGGGDRPGVVELPLACERPLLDIDTREDWRELLGRDSST
ncbi:MAG: nucleotidyltransferase family protein [Acidobacteriota bacterium]|nr:nucleotidyltransferase family protein [Acidobacteriota bacterium]